MTTTNNNPHTETLNLSNDDAADVFAAAPAEGVVLSLVSAAYGVEMGRLMRGTMRGSSVVDVAAIHYPDRVLFEAKTELGSIFLQIMG